MAIMAFVLVTALAAPAGWLEGQRPPEPYPAGEEQPAQETTSELAQEKKEEKKDEKKEEKKDEKKGLTLKSDRKVEFTTDEATWLSLDVSPDGKTIVFELLGDLYTLPIAGGAATRLAVSDVSHKDGSSMAFDSQPRYSPDGKWIAFLSDRDGAENVWVCKSDGTEPKKLSKSTDAEFASPAWMPDGEYVIVSRTGWAQRTYELWMYHVRGGSGVQVTKAKPTPTTTPAQLHNALGVSPSPDGKYLYYARKAGGFQYNANFPMWQIARRDMVTGDEDSVTSAVGSAVRPLLSPDGTQLIYGTRYETQTGLRIRDLRTGDDRWLKYPVTRDDQESRFTRDLLPGYAFLPGGKEIIATYGGKIQRVNIETGSAATIRFTAQVAQEIGPKLYFPQRVDDASPVRWRVVQTPVQSPDGKRLAFSAVTRVYVMDVPGGAPKLLTGQGRQDGAGTAREFQPAWSPDGAWIAYVTWSGGAGHIWKMRADGSGSAVQLTRTPAFYSDVVWSPDGSRIVALRGSRQLRVENPFDFGPVQGSDLVWLPAAGGEISVIVPSRGAGTPHFAKNPDRIYVYSNAGLISLRYDGTDRRRHLQVRGPGIYSNEEPIPADDIRISPDGKWVMAHVSNQLYVMALPPLGGDAPTVNIKSASIPLKQISDVGADYWAWADDGKTLTWAVGATFFRQPLSTVQFEPPKKDESGEAKKDEAPAQPKKDGNGDTQQAEKKTEEKKDEKAEKKEEKPLYEAIEIAVTQPRSKPEGAVVLRGAKVVTMKGDEVIENADVVITGNRIAGVGRRGSVTAPANARVIDVRGATIVPGFIDTHAHWFEIRRGILDLQNWSFLANLAYGVTAGLDVQTGTNDMFAYQDLVEMGMLPGPRAYSTGPGIFSNNTFDSLDATKKVINKYKKHYGTRHLKSYIVGNRKQRQWMVEACKELEMMPTTEGGLDLKLDLTHTIDGFKGNEHNLPIVPLYKDVAELVAKAGLYYTPTLIVTYGGPFGENYWYTNSEVHDDPKLNHFIPHNLLDQKTLRVQWFRKDQYAFSKVAEAAGKIVRSGGRVGVGSHGQLQGLGYHWELWMLQSGGLTNMETLRAATLHGAEALGLAQDLGSIEPGKLADLVILARDPLADIKNTNSVRYVMKNGELFEGDTLDQIWPQQKPLPELWWWKDKPPATADQRTTP